MIRRATLDDLGRAVELLQASRVGAGFNRPDGPTGFTFPFSREKAERLFLFHLDRPDACCLVYERAGVARGLLLAVAYEHPFGVVILSKETLWFIEPEHRGGTAAVRWPFWCARCQRVCHWCKSSPQSGRGLNWQAQSKQARARFGTRLRSQRWRRRRW